MLLLAANLAGRAGDLDLARSHLAKTLELAPKDVRPYQALAETELRGRRVDEAIGWLDKGVEALPDEASLQVTRVETLILADRLDEAAAEIARARRPAQT